jgi:Predicted phosphatase homologous to the C-terminal domain of histone macroH2A1
MPFNIIRNDIVKMKVDAIVNAANSGLKQGGGVCGRIFSAVGEQEMTKACDAIGWCEPGSAVITPGFNLPAKFVIHTVGPVWQGGKQGEEEVLRSAYRSSLELALQHGLESVAFPLISSGIYGYPYEEALAVALDEINRFLFQHDMQVTLVMFDQTAVALGFKLRKDLISYIDDHYVSEHLDRDRQRRYLDESRPSSSQVFQDSLQLDEPQFIYGAPLTQPADEIKGFKIPKEKHFRKLYSTSSMPRA